MRKPPRAGRPGEGDARAGQAGDRAPSGRVASVRLRGGSGAAPAHGPARGRRASSGVTPRLALRDGRPTKRTPARPRAQRWSARVVPPLLEAALFDLSFRPVARSRPFALVSPGFEAVAVDEPVLTELDLGPTAPAAPWTAVELDVRRVGG